MELVSTYKSIVSTVVSAVKPALQGKYAPVANARLAAWVASLSAVPNVWTLLPTVLTVANATTLVLQVKYVWPLSVN